MVSHYSIFWTLIDPLVSIINMSLSHWGIFERVMYNRLEEFLKSSEVFYKYQFGFRKHYSTNHALISIVEKIRDALGKNMYTCGVFIDLEKAFDTVNHQILNFIIMV